MVEAVVVLDKPLAVLVRQEQVTEELVVLALAKGEMLLLLQEVVEVVIVVVKVDLVLLYLLGKVDQSENENFAYLTSKGRKAGWTRICPLSFEYLYPK